MKKAFTLSEILITLAIIGVIATIVMPVLISYTNKSITVAKIKKVYNILSTSTTMAIANEGYSIVADGSDNDAENWFHYMIESNTFVVKSCANSPGCWNSGTKMIDGSKPTYDKGNSGIGGNNKTFITREGFFFNLDGTNAKDMTNIFGVNTSSDAMSIYVDINGDKGPNTVGKDVFALTYTAERGFLPAGADKTYSQVTSNCKTKGLFCLQQIVNDGWSADKMNL